MIGHNFKLNDFTLGFVANFTDDLFQPYINAVNQDPTAILRTKDNVILAGVHYIVVCLINIIAHIGYYTESTLIMQVLFLAGCFHLAWNNVQPEYRLLSIHPHA